MFLIIKLQLFFSGCWLFPHVFLNKTAKERECEAYTAGVNIKPYTDVVEVRIQFQELFSKMVTDCFFMWGRVEAGLIINGRLCNSMLTSPRGLSCIK